MLYLYITHRMDGHNAPNDVACFGNVTESILGQLGTPWNDLSPNIFIWQLVSAFGSSPMDIEQNSTFINKLVTSLLKMIIYNYMNTVISRLGVAWEFFI